MNQKIPDEGTCQDRWARFRFSVVGPLFSAPPKSGELRESLISLSKKQWNHPITGKPVTFSFSTIENWFYQARKQNNPIIACVLLASVRDRSHFYSGTKGMSPFL